MGRISSSVGLVSGINSKDIIDQLMALEQRPKLLLQSRKDKLAEQKTVYSEFITKLSSLESLGRTFARPSTFTAAKAASGDEDILTATTAPGAAFGSYQFQVARLVTSQQSVSNGFSDASAVVGAGTLTLEMGGGSLAGQTQLSQLNGGAGVRRGLFRITDRSGKNAIIDTTTAITIDDVVRKINTALDISVTASVDGDRIVLTDGTGQTTSNLIVQDMAGGLAADDLGLVGDVAADTLNGADINFLGAATTLNSLNDGRGVRTHGTLADFRVTLRNGSTIDVNLANTRTLGEVIAKINEAGGANLKASVDPGANVLKLTDNTGGGGTLSVAALNGSKAAADLGIQKNGSGGTLTGNEVLAGMNTVLLSSLRGGTGIPLGEISIRDRSGGTANVDLSGAKTVQDILDAINTTAGIDVTASLKSSGNGIQLTDSSGGTGDIVIGDVDSTTAEVLGIKGTFDASKPAVLGANLQMQWVNENTLLSTLNGGRGVTPGAFKITNSAGVTAEVNLTAGAATTLGQVISAINSSSAGVTAGINANGDGLLLTDTAGGAGKLKVANSTGTTATDLNIVGEATTTTLDGSWEKTVEVLATDTLTTVQTKLKDLGFGVAAAIINDGSSTAPYRLSLTAFNSGRAGRVLFDAGETALATQTLVEAQDAAAFLGSSSAEQPLLVTSSSNQLANIIPGVTVELNGVSDRPVSLNITRDPDSVVEQVGKFVEDFNGVADKIKELTTFDTETKTAGLLLGESVIPQVQQQMYVALQAVVVGAGRYRLLSDVGIKIVDAGKIEFNEEKFRSTFATDPEAVKNLFTQTAGALSGATPLTALNSGKGVRTATSGADFRITARDGTNIDVTLGTATSLQDALAAINTAAAGKVTVAVNTNGTGLTLTDATAGTGTLSVGLLNGSLAATDLGIGGIAVGSTLAGTSIFNSTDARGGGIAMLIQRSMKALVDPSDGILTRQNRLLDDRSQQFQNRMDAIDKLVEQKRGRLERQFANLESVLANLQSQQSAIGNLTQLQPVQARSSTR